MRAVKSHGVGTCALTNGPGAVSAKPQRSRTILRVNQASWVVPVGSGMTAVEGSLMALQ